MSDRSLSELLTIARAQLRARIAADPADARAVVALSHVAAALEMLFAGADLDPTPPHPHKE